MAQTLETIIELQNALDRLHGAEAQLSGIPDWMRELDEEYQERKAHIDELEAAVERAASERRVSDAGIADTQTKLKRYQEQLNTVTNQREYGALLQEIDTAKTQISTHEEEGLAAMERSDAARKALEEERQAFADLDQRYQDQLAKWEAEKPEISRQAEELREEIEGYREQIPRAILARFERIHERMGGQALAPVRKMERPGKAPPMWHCTSCNYNVRPQVVVEIRNRGSLIPCDSCKRILYVEPAESEADGGDGDEEE